MRPSAIASLGGVCLLFAATAAVGATTTSSLSNNAPTGKQPPASARATGPQSDNGGQYYRQWNDRSGKSQKQSTSDRRPAFQKQGAYVLQHPDDWDPGAYFYNKTPGRQFTQRRDWQQGDFAYGSARYYGTWYQQNRDEHPQFQPEERQEVLQVLMSLDQSDRDRLIERFSNLDGEDREQMRSLFGIDEQPKMFNGRSNKFKSDRTFNRTKKTQGRKWQPTGKGQASQSPTAKSKTTQWQSGTGQFQGEGGFMQQIAQALQDDESSSLAAVHHAREHLTPQQRIAMFEPLLDDPSGSQEARNAAYLILIETYRDMDDMQKSMKLAQAMIAENHGYQD